MRVRILLPQGEKNEADLKEFMWRSEISQAEGVREDHM